MKNTPQRMCIVCREMKDKRDLIRVVRSKDGEVSIDLSGKTNGRGAYLCKSEDCINQSIKKKCLERAFGLNIDAQIFEELRKEIGSTNN